MPLRVSRARLHLAALYAACAVCAPTALAQDSAATLRERYAALTPALAQSPIQPGLHVESVESVSAPRGDAYAVIHYPFATVAAAFTHPQTWCESLILHLNVQYCRASMDGERALLSAAVGKKTNQPLDDTHRINFIYKVAASKADFLRVELAAREGPLGTANYLIALELIELDNERAFMHIQYSYTQGVLARLATSAYFATRGRDKVGFTRIQDGDEPPQLVRGIRGAIERNTMRYYLAFDAYLDALESPAPQRFENSIQRWFTDTERFARQLREVDHDDYITMKRGQYLRQQSVR